MVTDLLVRCAAWDIDLAVGSDGSLIWESDRDPPEWLLGEIAEYKVELLDRLRAEAPRRERAESDAAAQVLPPWNQVEADRLLDELKAEAEKIKNRFNGKSPRAMTVLLDDAMNIATRYVRDHEAEAARGWDTLDLLRGMVPMIRESEKNTRQKLAAGQAAARPRVGELVRRVVIRPQDLAGVDNRKQVRK